VGTAWGNDCVAVPTPDLVVSRGGHRPHRRGGRIRNFALDALPGQSGAHQDAKRHLRYAEFFGRGPRARRSRRPRPWSPSGGGHHPGRLVFPYVLRYIAVYALLEHVTPITSVFRMRS